jgi:hypothetical protein
MSDSRQTDGWEREPLTHEDRVLVSLVGRYVERRERGLSTHVGDLFTVASEFGDTAVTKLRTVLAAYEALRASEDDHAR